MMKRILCAILAMALLCGCALAECPSVDAASYPRVDGSTATLPLSYALYCAATGATREEAEQTIEHSRTTQSFYGLAYDWADLLLVYEPAAEALELLEEEGVAYEMKPIGRDALVFLINAANPVESLTQQQVVDIYTGRITNWKQVGGNDLDIIAYQRNATSGSQVMMKALCMKGEEMAEAPETYMVAEMEGLIRSVASYSNTADAIGYSVYYYASRMYTEDGVRLVPIDGVAPTNQSIADGSYPYTQDFYAVIRADAAEDSIQRRLFDWLTTDEGRQLIEEAGYVPAETK